MTTSRDLDKTSVFHGSLTSAGIGEEYKRIMIAKQAAASAMSADQRYLNEELKKYGYKLVTV